MALRQDQEALEARSAEATQRHGDPPPALRSRLQLLGPDTAVIKDPRTLARIKALVIPPAWEDVWICVDPQGHIQAIGTDAAAGASTGTTTCGVSSGIRRSMTGSWSSGPPCRESATSFAVTWRAAG